jgi:trehalose 6-phosphate phosphatase
MHGESVIRGAAALERAVSALAGAARASALFCDIDGTVSPIVARPPDAIVPGEFRAVLARLVARLGLVAFVTGRAVQDGRRMVAVEGAAYVGMHGLEVMDVAGHVHSDAAAEPYAALIQRMAGRAVALAAAHPGVFVENKRTIVGLHYRNAVDPEAVRSLIEREIVVPAGEAGLRIGTGHLVVEVHPPIPFSKGKATAALLATGDYVTTVFCGDDLTDVTGFTAIREWAAADERRTACAVAAVTAETPPPVFEAADVLVTATPGVLEVLRRLSAAADSHTASP